MAKHKETKNSNFKRAYFADLKNHSSLIKNYNSVTINRNFYHSVKCPRCGHSFSFKGDLRNHSAFYECRNCKYQMKFFEYQKRFINFNWPKTIELGFKLYSWDQMCSNCEHINPCISYCINQSVGTEELCLFEPLLLGSVPELDRFIMRFCSSVNLFPDPQGKLIPTVFCSKCDAPYSSQFFLESFLNQTSLDIEYTIRSKQIFDMLELKPESITSLIDNLKYLED